jgi:predicted DNA-binding transcriptional regulator AlpA
MRKAKQTEPMRSYNFTLILSGVREIEAEVEDALFDAGCDDALLGSRDGVVFLDFEREAPSAREAVLSAIADVGKAGIGARVARVEPDELVTMAEIARRTNRSRENIRQLAAGLRGPGDFPPPVANLKQKSPIWRWADVEAWLLQREEAGESSPRLPAPSDLGAGVAAINAGLEMLRHVGSAAEAEKLLESLE